MPAGLGDGGLRLALVMIARDEAPRIARALESAAPFVDQMIVLDTGSVDGTQAIAAGCGAAVHDFAWVDDFSAARNAALAHSDADWNLILDADEWLEGSTEALAALPAGQGGFIGHVQVASQIPQDGGTGLSSSWIPRVLPRGVRYSGRIHEQPNSTLPGRRLALRIGHDGYLAEAVARKAGRNVALLLEELRAAPEDDYLWFQLGKEHQGRGDTEEAADCMARAYNLCPPDAPYRHALIVRAISALTEAGALDDGRALANAEAGNWPDSPDFWFVVGALFLEWSTAHPDQALSEGLPLCEYAWKRCLEIGERDDIDGGVRGRGGHMAAHNLAVMYETFGLGEQAASYRALSETLKRAG